MRRPPAGRLVALLGMMVLALAGVGTRLVILQVGDHRAFAAQGLDQRVHLIDLPAERGAIVDRTGVPLAITLEARDVYADPRYVTDPIGEAARIAKILDLQPRQVERLLRTPDSTFVYLGRQVDAEDAEKLESLGLPGIGFLDVPKRYYPAGALAPQVLGFVGVDATGLAGLEFEYQDVLAGSPGTRTVELSADGLPIASGIEVVEPAIRGETLVTTLDREVQYLAQEALQRAVKENGAKGGTIVVMDARTGDVYAMASYPWFDPNDFETAERDAIRNRAVTDMFEPGSVNKVVTAAAALETGAVGLRKVFRVPSWMRVGGYTVNDSHAHPIQDMTLGDIVAQSSNIGSAMIAERVGSADLASVLARFGYGTPTGRRPRSPQLDRHHADDRVLRTGHLDDAAADGRRLRHGGQRRDVGAAPARPRHLRLRWAGPADTSRRTTSGPLGGDGDDAHPHARLRGVFGHGRRGGHPRLSGRRQDRHGPEVGRGQVRPAVHGVVRGVLPRVGSPGGDRGVDRRASDDLRGCGGRPGLLRDRATRDPAPRDPGRTAREPAAVRGGSLIGRPAVRRVRLAGSGVRRRYAGPR